MIFSSWVFIFGFMPIVLLGFLLISRIDHRYSRIWLCAASLLFYGWWDIKWVPVLVASVIFNYIVGLALISRANAERRTDIVLGFGVLANILALVYYKYLFSIVSFFGFGDVVSLPRSLPLGISFFTFTQIAFLIDVSQGFRQRYTPVNYTLFVTFFPHLIAGPIVHHRDLMPQFEDEKNYRFQPREFAIGLSIFSMGLAKKTLIADNVSGIAVRMLDSGQGTPFTAWVGVLSYSMQLYFDFSGYSDMAIGLARMFGIKFPVNFDSPYKATSIIEFWQRWHITLTRFLTAYLYNPIALMLVRRRASAGLATTKRASRTVRGFLELIALPTMATMVVAGVWHGAGLQFVVFGALHGFYISANHAWRTFGPKGADGSARLAGAATTLAYGVLVYLCVLIAQIFFRANSVSSAMALLSDMFLLHAATQPQCLEGALAACAHSVFAASPSDPQVSMRDLLLLVSSMVVVWLAPNTQQIMAKYEPVIDLGRKPAASRLSMQFSPWWAVGLGAILFLGLINIHDGQPFLYFQF